MAAGAADRSWEESVAGKRQPRGEGTYLGSCGGCHRKGSQKEYDRAPDPAAAFHSSLTSYFCWTDCMRYCSTSSSEAA